MNDTDLDALARRRGGTVTGVNAAAFAAATCKDRLHVGRLPACVSEAAFQRAVIALAQELGWWVVEFRRARTKHGWTTPFGADGVGMTDLILVRERVVFAELKAVAGRLRPDQRRWRDRLLAAGAEWHCWKPTNMLEIRRTLA